MNIVRHIRKNLFGVTQAEFAEEIGRMQSTVSRWESGVEMTRSDCEAILLAAKRRGVDLSAETFFPLLGVEEAPARAAGVH